MRFFQDVGNLDESFFWKTLENRYAANEKKKRFGNEKLLKSRLFGTLNYVNRIQLKFHFL